MGYFFLSIRLRGCDRVCIAAYLRGSTLLFVLRLRNKLVHRAAEFALHGTQALLLSYAVGDLFISRQAVSVRKRGALRTRHSLGYWFMDFEIQRETSSAQVVVTYSRPGGGTPPLPPPFYILILNACHLFQSNSMCVYFSLFFVVPLASRKPSRARPGMETGDGVFF